MQSLTSQGGEYMRYQCADPAGGTTFFIVNLAERRSDLLVQHIDDLGATMKTVKVVQPFAIWQWWCYPNTCMRYGASHWVTPSICYTGHSSRLG